MRCNKRGEGGILGRPMDGDWIRRDELSLLPQLLHPVDDFARNSFVDHRLIRRHVENDEDVALRMGRVLGTRGALFRRTVGFAAWRSFF